MKILFQYGKLETDKTILLSMPPEKLVDEANACHTYLSKHAYKLNIVHKNILTYSQWSNQWLDVYGEVMVWSKTFTFILDIRLELLKEAIEEKDKRNLLLLKYVFELWFNTIFSLKNYWMKGKETPSYKCVYNRLSILGPIEYIQETEVVFVDTSKIFSYILYLKESVIDL